MAGIKYTQAQIKELKANRYVKNVTQKSITISLECKIEVLKLNKKWLFYTEIFKKLWFPEYIINSKIPQRSFHRWNYKNNNWLIEDKKWRPKVEKIDFNNLTKDQYIEYLETKLEFYEEMKKYIDSWSL
mgnify:FL=1